MKTEIMTIRINPTIKKEANELFESLGLTMSSAIDIFLRQCIRERALPFVPHEDVPNKATIEAIEEGERMMKDPNTKWYDNVDDLMNALDSEDED